MRSVVSPGLARVRTRECRHGILCFLYPPEQLKCSELIMPFLGFHGRKAVGECRGRLCLNLYRAYFRLGLPACMMISLILQLNGMSECARELCAD